MEHAIGKMAEIQLAQVQAQAQAVERRQAERVDVPNVGLPEGMTRFVASSRNYQISMEPAWQENVGGRMIVHPGHMIVFQNGVYDASEEEAEFLRGRPE